jgi:hypothetical protein
MTSSEKEQNTWNDDPYYKISLAVHRSRRYHAKMRAHYERLSNLILAANAILGTGAFVSLFGPNGAIPKVLIGIVAAGSALDRVLGFAHKAKVYDGLCRRFTELAAGLEQWDATPANLKKATSKRYKIEEDEPTVRRLVDLDARNEELRARGYSADEMVPLSSLQKNLGCFVTFDMRRLERWLEERENARREANSV